MKAKNAARQIVPQTATAIRNAGNFRRVQLEYPVAGCTLRADTDRERAASQRTVTGASRLDAATPVIVQEMGRLFTRFSQSGHQSARIKITDAAGICHALQARVGGTGQVTLSPA